jgi:hypothetical protein
MHEAIQEVAVEVDVSTLERAGSGAITGVVFLRVGGEAFPDDGWSDFPVAILGWWIEGVSRISRGESRTCECLFMDGPERFRLEPKDGDAWSLLAFHHDRKELAATISFAAFRRSLVVAAEAVRSACRARGWQSPDLDVLDAAIRRIQNSTD